MQVKGTVSFTEPSSFPHCPCPTCFSCTFFPPFLNLTSGKGKLMNFYYSWWFPFLVHLPVKKVKETTSLADNDLPTQFEDKGLSA